MLHFKTHIWALAAEDTERLRDARGDKPKPFVHRALPETFHLT